MLDVYRQMAADVTRNAAMRRAIAAAVRPGDVAADFGCGLGLFCVYACRAGASRVLAVEAGPIVTAAEGVFRQNGCASTVQVLRGLSTRLEVPALADVVVFEDFHCWLLDPRTTDIIGDVLARWLKPGGRLVPSRARLRLAAIEDAAAHANTDLLAPLGERVCDVDLSTTRLPAFSRWERRKLAPEAALFAPLELGEVELARAQPGLRYEGRARALRDGVVHGLALWFELDLEGTWLGNAPGAQSWGAPAFFPLASPLSVSEGGELELRLRGSAVGEVMVWRWSVAAASGRCEHSSLDGSLLPWQELQRRREDHVPALAPALTEARAILALVDGKRTLVEIARALGEQFPDLPETVARRRVADLLASLGA